MKSDPFFDAIANDKFDIDDELKTLEEMDDRLRQRLAAYVPDVCVERRIDFGRVAVIGDE